MTTADELKAEMEYAAHVLRYGGFDAHHHEEKKEDPHMHAQTGEDAAAGGDQHGNGHGGYGGDDPQAEAFRQALADAKAGFDKLVMDAREEYSAAVQGAVADSRNRGDALNAGLADSTAEALRALREGLDAELGLLQAANDSRYTRFVEWSGSELEDFQAAIQEAIDDANKWFGERLEWVAKLYDTTYREQLEQQLTERRDAAL